MNNKNTIANNMAKAEIPKQELPEIYDAENLASGKETWNILNEMQEMEQFDTNKAWNSLYKQLKEQELIQEKSRIIKSMNFRWSYAVAASIALLIGVFAFSFLQEHLSSTSYYNKELAVLKVLLPDGTEVNLNKDAEIKYKRTFGKANRTLSLSGEAFFKVKPDKNHPFIINTTHTAIKVLGTSFNIKSSKKEVEVIVKTGTVEVYNTKTNHQTMVLNNGEGCLSTKTGLKKQINKRENYLAWLNKKLVFKAMPLPLVINDINQAYHSNIELGDKGMENLVITTTFENNTIDEIIESISLALDLKVKTQDEKYILVSK